MNRLSDSERIAQAQAMVAEMAQRLGVAIAINNQVRRIDDGSVIVTPVVNLTLIEGWKHDGIGDNQ